MLHKVVLTFESVNEILKCDLSYESCRAEPCVSLRGNIAAKKKHPPCYLYHKLRNALPTVSSAHHKHSGLYFFHSAQTGVASGHPSRDSTQLSWLITSTTSTTMLGSVSSRECLDALAFLATFTAGRTGLVIV